MQEHLRRGARGRRGAADPGAVAASRRSGAERDVRPAYRDRHSHRRQDVSCRCQKRDRSPIRPSSTQSRSSGRRRRAFCRRKVVPWLFVLPILLINVAVVLGPALSVVLLLDDRLERDRRGGMGRAGQLPHASSSTIPSFRHAFRNNVIWLAMFLTVPIAMALIAASLLAPIRRGALFFRMALFMPYVLPSVVIAGIWRTLLQPGPRVSAPCSPTGASPGSTRPSWAIRTPSCRPSPSSTTGTGGAS